MSQSSPLTNVLVIQQFSMINCTGVMQQLHSTSVSVLEVAHRKLQEEKVALVNLIMEKFVAIFAAFKIELIGKKKPDDSVMKLS